ncbi:catechol 2,3-dioxygenase [Ilumatobacter sp.]|uniref:catechol 2,3-dioxygenase n=1 Tax=Ilumatobacter sp. TaxID=1967498 RepID=UPI003B517FC5
MSSPGILRLSHATVRVPDLELAVAYYAEVVGLVVTAREGTRAYLKGWDEQQHHSLILQEAPTYGLDGLAFKVVEEPELDRLADRVTDAGIDVERFHPGEFGEAAGATVRFTAPSGHVIDLECGQGQVGNGLSLINPPPAPDDLVGMHPPRVDHIFLLCEDVDGATAFFQDVLEFRLTEQIVADDGHQLATFLERTHTPHDIAFLTGPDGGFHHLAFWVDEWNDLRTAADTCTYHGVTIDAGPTRHGATRGCGLYFFDPAGNRNEVFTGGYHFDPDDEPTVWTEAEMGRAIFSYRGQVDQKFMTVHS